MNCTNCGNDEMIFQYDVEERNVLFVLWDCTCGNKVLERRAQETAGVLVAADAIPAEGE